MHTGHAWLDFEAIVQGPVYAISYTPICSAVGPPMGTCDGLTAGIMPLGEGQ